MTGFAEGTPCWVVGMLPDLAAGRRFYGELMGWGFSEPDPERDAYTVALSDGRAAAGMLAKPDGRTPTDWVQHLATSDAKAAVERVRAAGGQVMMDPFELGGTGVTAVVADPGGAVFQLWQAGSHRGFQTGPEEPGGYAWAEVHTREVSAVDAFYQRVFGFGSEDEPDGQDPEFRIWVPRGERIDEEHAVLGRAVIGAEEPAELPAHFLTYFRVRDCAEASRTTVRLGGRVMLPPTDTPYLRYAILADDQGARFAVLTDNE
ncbi:hydrolase [Streptomyces oceani]|uniref:Hydrolase n=2 Tax=Streptomyces oceani TaxID=1075402 RepID=A0A1E7KMR9_9ACTN|nr:VOC family protein [Streptomyces oceani]OEV05203.1 hydrolase [Streptomyces oceani]